MKKIFLFIFFIIILSGTCQAVLISYTHQERYFFTPGAEFTFKFDVLSNTDQIMDHTIYLGGGLKNYSTVSTYLLPNMSPGESRPITATLKLPNSLPPGFNLLFVCIEEKFARSGADGGGNIGTRAAVCGDITIISLYDYPFLEFEFDAPNVALNTENNFILEIQSLTKQEMLISGQVDIYHVGEKVATVSSESVNLPSAEKLDMKILWNNTGHQIGKYLAVATVYYPGGSLVKNSSFRIGDLSMSIINFTEEVEKRDLEKIWVLAKNNWNDVITSVYASFNVSKDSQEVQFIATPVLDFGAWDEKYLETYLDTKLIAPGEYDLEVKLRYSGKTEISTGKLNIVKKFRFSFNTILLILILLILLLIIVFIIWWLMRKRKDEKKDKIQKESFTESKK
ncbi:MAG: hypothetical protein ABH817_02080 [archaeon]